MAKADYYTVIASFTGTLDGRDVEYHAGEVVSADDPALKKMPAHFAPLVVRAIPGKVEQATAVPGEKRS
jgi:hypothetical protein